MKWLRRTGRMHIRTTLYHNFFFPSFPIQHAMVCSFVRSCVRARARRIELHRVRIVCFWPLFLLLYWMKQTRCVVVDSVLKAQRYHLCAVIKEKQHSQDRQLVRIQFSFAVNENINAKPRTCCILWMIFMSCSYHIHAFNQPSIQHASIIFVLSVSVPFFVSTHIAYSILYARIAPLKRIARQFHFSILTTVLCISCWINPT